MSVTSGIINSFFEGSYELSINSSTTLYPIIGTVVELIPEQNSMTIEFESSDESVDKFFADGVVDLDFISSIVKNQSESTFLNLPNVPVNLNKINNYKYKLFCSLPNSIFLKDKRGTIRIPFILGMRAEVMIEVFPHILNISGVVRNLSTGGCLVEIDFADSIPLEFEQEFSSVVLKFPNGDNFVTKGQIRHIRPLGSNGKALAGIQFIELSESHIDKLVFIVSESEREAAFRIGLTGMLTDQSKLFIASKKIKGTIKRIRLTSENEINNFSMRKGVLEIVHRLQIGLMYLKTRNKFSHEIFYDCADTLQYLVKLKLKCFLYALSSIEGESEWARHAVQVAGRLAFVLNHKDPHHPQLREIILASLLHTMGKPLLVGPELPTLKMKMDITHKKILQGHVSAFLRRINQLGWEPSPTCLDLIENANELINGKGYPNGRQSSELSYNVKLITIIKLVNKLTHERNGRKAITHLAAYRYIRGLDAYDPNLLVEYIQLNGIYPIGTMVKYTSGFIGWVVDINSKGLPCEVLVIKNINFPDSNLNVLVANSDLVQLGKLQRNISPEDYDIATENIMLK